MARITARESAHIDSPPASVYALLADYRNGHPRILPERYFTTLEVEEGGIGAGTRIRVGVRMLGTVQTLRLEVAEPEPGRLLTERDLERGAVTHFRVEPDGDGSRVTLSVDFQVDGVAGWLMSRLMPGYLSRLYREELGILQRVMMDDAAGQSGMAAAAVVGAPQEGARQAG